MTRISVTSSMYQALMMAVVLVCTATVGLGQVQTGTAIGPGVGGQVHAFAFDPSNPDAIYAGGDVCGVYRYSIAANRWEPWSNGLGFGDLNWSYYVDDLLVLREVDGVPANACGVYAATWGGVYYRPNDQTPWRCLTYDDNYSGGYVLDRVRGSMRIPFSSLAYDRTTQTLYAGAGHGRTRSDKYSEYTNFYPTSCSPTPPLRSCSGEFSLWSCDLSGDVTPPQFTSVPGTAHGKTRQIAFADYVDSGGTQRHEVLYACDSGLWIVGDTSPLWSPDTANKSAAFNAAVHAVDPGGVVVGSDATCYIVTTDFTNLPEVLDTGVWQFDLKIWPRTSTSPAWAPVASVDDYLWPRPMPWSEYLANNGDQFTELSIVLNEDNRGDALYVGSGRPPANDGGYFRYGSYVDETGANRRGWAHIQRTEGSDPGYDTGRTLHVADWRNDRIRDIELTETQVGWHSFQIPNRPLLPFAVNTWADSIMVASDVGVPMLSTNYGGNWRNLYCGGNEAAGWSSLGLNLLCTGSSTFFPTGELVIGAYDYGVFVGSSSANTSFLPIHEGTYTPPDWPSAIDVEVQIRNDAREYFMVDAEPTPSVIWTWDSTQWRSISTGLATGMNGAPFVIADIVIANEDHVYAAVGKVVSPAGAAYPQYHFHIWEGERPATGWDWTWTVRVDVDAGVGAGVQTRQVNRMCLIPGTPLLMLATKHKGTSAGGLIPINVSTWQAGPAWLGGNYTGGSPPQDALGRLGVNVTSVVADRLGRYLYVGCGGGDSASSPGRGGVVRFPMNSGAPGSAEILAGFGDINTPDGDVFGIHGPSGVNNFASLNPGTTQDWEFCTRVNDIEIDPNNPLVAYVAVGAGNIPFYHAKFGAWRVKGTAWDQIWGANETGSGAKTVGISPSDNSTLYVGSVGQEFFKAQILASDPPTIAGAAAAPVWATGTSVTTTVSVAISHPDEFAIETAELYASTLGQSEVLHMYDGGPGVPAGSIDAVAGDGIFTSEAFGSNVAAGTYGVTVFAQASDGSYASQAVAVQAVGNPIGENAVYRFRAGSSDASYVLAVAVTSPPAWVQVTANLASVNGPNSLVLADDGLGQDVKSGDGIFTSARFAAAMPDTGVYVALVTGEPEVGGPVTQQVNMLAVANAAKFTADSDPAVATPIAGALSGGLATKPYASIYFWAQPNDDESDKVMITTFDDNETAPGIWGRSRQLTGVDGPFEDRRPGAPSAWLGASLPGGSRGVCYADFDNDGDTDFFLCNPTYGGKLYVNYLSDTICPEDWRGKFINRTSAICGADSVYLAGAISASWGDYTEDGFVDLFVSTASYSGPIDELDELPAVASGSITGGDLRLFKNFAGTAMKKAMIFGSSSSPICLAGCWVDLDDDGDLDLVTTRYSGGGLSVLENHGINATHTDQDMEEVTWAPTASNLGANSITVIDYDHDAHLDLFVTECTGSRKQAWILRNNYGSAGSKTFSAVAFGPERAWSGAVVADFNLDGQDDFVLLPKEADVVPPLYMSNGYMTFPEFEDPSWPIQTKRVTPYYADLGYTLGLRAGRTGGGFAADLDGDHAADLFLGRTSTPQINSQFLYRSTGTAAATNHWLQVNVRTCGGSNGSLIGTRVQVVANGKQWLKVVDGGSFRGGQGSNDLLFGLTGETSVDYVKIMFPSGEVDQLVPGGVDQVLTAHEDAIGGVVPGSAAFSYELKPGAADWVFRWQTAGVKGDLREDRVSVSPYSGTNECLATPTFQRSWGMSGVSVFAYRVGTNWQHELRWSDGDCITGCRWSFVGHSGAGADCEASVATPAAVSPRLTYCIPGNYGQ